MAIIPGTSFEVAHQVLDAVGQVADVHYWDGAAHAQNACRHGEAGGGNWARGQRCGLLKVAAERGIHPRGLLAARQLNESTGCPSKRLLSSSLLLTALPLLTCS